MKTWLTVKEYAEIMGYRVEHVRDLCRTRRIRARKPEGAKEWRIHRSEAE